MNKAAREDDRVVLEETVYASTGAFAVKTRRKALKLRGPTARGRRIRRANVEGSGSYIKARMPTGSPHPIAIDATLRAAAPHQMARREAGLVAEGGISVQTRDLRRKVLSRLTGASVLFAVDASGSMGSKEVMGHAKGVVLGLLTDAYQKRDRVAMISFRGTEAPLALPFTTSVELAQRRLANLPTGGKSPLALALAKAAEVLKRELTRNPGRTPMLVLLTDGRANISMAGADPFEEALTQARRIKALGIRAMVVDTDMVWIDSYPWARVLANAMGAKCLRLMDLKVGKIVEFITG